MIISRRNILAFTSVLATNIFWSAVLRVPFTGDEPSYYVNSWALAHGYGRNVLAASKILISNSALSLQTNHILVTPFGNSVSWHQCLLAVLLTPVTFFSLKVFYVRLLMSLYTAIGSLLFLELIDKIFPDNKRKNLISWVSIFCFYPIGAFAGLAYPDLIASYIYCGAILLLAEQKNENEKRQLILAGLILFLLPNLGIKFSVLIGPLLIFILSRSFKLALKTRIAVFGYLFTVGIVWIIYMSWFYSSLWFIKVISDVPSPTQEHYWKIDNLYTVGIGSWISNTGGLIFVAPFIAIPMAYLSVYFHKNKDGLIKVAFIGLGLYLITVSLFGTTGFSFSYRYFMPLVPFLIVPLAFALSIDKKKIIHKTLAILIILSLAIAGSIASNPGSMLLGLPNSAKNLTPYSKIFPQLIGYPPAEKTYIYKGRDLMSAIAVNQSTDGSVTTKSSSESGFLAYGPYSQLPVGTWIARVDLSNSATNSLDIEIIGDAYEILAKKHITRYLNQKIDLEFKTTNKWPNIQLRITTYGKGQVTFKSLEFVQVSSAKTKDIFDFLKSLFWLSLLLLAWAADYLKCRFRKIFQTY